MPQYRSSKVTQGRAAMNALGDRAWQPAQPRPRQVSVALRAYGLLATSADRGAVRDLSGLRRVIDKPLRSNQTS